MSQREPPEQSYRDVGSPAVCTGLQGIRCEAGAECKCPEGGTCREDAIRGKSYRQVEEIGLYPKGREKPAIGF